MPVSPTTVFDARAMDRTIRRMADEIVELNDGTDNLILVGIQRRGVQVADRLVAVMKEREHQDVPRGGARASVHQGSVGLGADERVGGTA